MFESVLSFIERMLPTFTGAMLAFGTNYFLQRRQRRINYVFECVKDVAKKVDELGNIYMDFYIKLRSEEIFEIFYDMKDKTYMLLRETREVLQRYKVVFDNEGKKESFKRFSAYLNEEPYRIISLNKKYKGFENDFAVIVDQTLEEIIKFSWDLTELIDDNYKK